MLIMSKALRNPYIPGNSVLTYKPLSMGSDVSLRKDNIWSFFIRYGCPCVYGCSLLSDSVTPQGSVAHQTSLSMGFSRQEYWGGLPFSAPADLPYPGIKPRSLASPALAGRFLTVEPLGKPIRQLDGGQLE